MLLLRLADSEKKAYAGANNRLSYSRFTVKVSLTEVKRRSGRVRVKLFRGGVTEILNLQPRGSECKPYQVSVGWEADDADNIFVECADAARADYLITGNPRHFPKFWKKTKIITSREFIGIVGPHLLS
jgi:uncharacterized protein